MKLSLLAALLLCTTASAQDFLVPRGATWRYLDDGSDQGSAWSAPAFDDSLWASGPAQLGYGDGDEATVVSFGADSNNKFITTYFRHGFMAPNPGQYLTLNLRLQRDDGARVFLNGVEISRSGLPGGTVDFDTEADNTAAEAEEENFYWIGVDPALLAVGANVLAVEVHQTSPTSSDISFDAELIGSTTEVITRGPWLQLGTPTSLRVRWRTDIDSLGRVAYGTSPGQLNSILDDGVSDKDHDIEISGLAPNTRYYYSVGTPGDVLAGDDSEHTFLTAPLPGSSLPLRIWALGDSGTANLRADQVRDAYYAFSGATHTNLWLMLGDNAYPDGTVAQYQAAVFDTYPTLLNKSALFTTRGNHENNANAYFGLFNLPSNGEAGGIPSGTEAYYAFDWGNVHFVCLDSDSSDRSLGGPMWTWLDADLSSTAQEWIIAFWHHPPYTKGSHDSDTESNLIEMRENFLPRLEDAGVDLVLGGHSHSYERSFLIDGHYGDSSTFVESMKKSQGNGDPEGDGAYNRLDGPHRGSVYIVAGSSGKLTTGSPLDHPVMLRNRERYGSVVIDVAGGRMDVTFLTQLGTARDSFTLLNESYEGVYCVAPADSSGCRASLSSSGTASASDPTPFLVQASGVRNGAFGLLFYGFRPAEIPFSSGQRCVGGTVQRTGVQSSGPGSNCSGSFQVDFNARIQAGFDASLVPGEVVYAQYWYRDQAAPSGTGVSDALQFLIRP